MSTCGRLMPGPYWTKAYNAISGCTPVSPGCANCWARAMHERFHEEPFSKVTLHPERLSIPLRTRRPQVFFTDMCDPFHDAVPFEFLADMWHVMTGEADARPAPEHTFLILTKRIRRAVRFYDWVMAGGAGRPQDDALRDMFLHQGPHPRVWGGATAEDQERADERFPDLLRLRGKLFARIWVSLEPMLGPIDLDEWMPQKAEVRRCDPNFEQCCGCGDCEDLPGLDHVIIGGESGPRARPCDVDWIREIVAQCREAGTKCFVKQLGSNPRWNGVTFPRQAWPGETRLVDSGDGAWLPKLHSRSGSDPAEWPEDLRVRELAWRMP